MITSKKQNLKEESIIDQSTHFTKDGSLGLLALGDIGLHLWRQAIELHNQNTDDESSKINIKI